MFVAQEGRHDPLRSYEDVMTGEHPFQPFVERLEAAGEPYELKLAKTPSKAAEKRFRKACPDQIRLLDSMDGVWGARLSWRDGDMRFSTLKGGADDGRILLSNSAYQGVFLYLYGTAEGLVVEVKTSQETRTFPFPGDVDDYIAHGVRYGGAPLWQLITIGLVPERVGASLELELADVLAGRSSDWSDYIERFRGGWWPKKRPFINGYRLATPFQISSSLMGVDVPTALARFYTTLLSAGYPKNRYAHELSIGWKHGQWRLPTFYELLSAPRASRVLKNACRPEHHELLHLVRAEDDVFVDLENEGLFVWDHSQREMRRITLSLDGFFQRLIACGGINGWVFEFTEDAESRRASSEVVPVLKRVVPDLDKFLDDQGSL